MGLVGSGFTGGTAMLGFLLAAEVIAAAAVVSEAALIYVARTRNMIISLAMLALEAGLAAGLILIMRDEGLPQTFQATGPAIGAVRRARLRVDHQIAAAVEEARRAGVRLALGPGLGDVGRGDRRRWGALSAAADASAGHRRAGDPGRVRRSAVDQGLRARGPRAVPVEQDEVQELREAEEAAWRATRSRTTSSSPKLSAGSAASR